MHILCSCAVSGASPCSSFRTSQVSTRKGGGALISPGSCTHTGVGLPASACPPSLLMPCCGALWLAFLLACPNGPYFFSTGFMVGRNQGVPSCLPPPPSYGSPCFFSAGFMVGRNQGVPSCLPPPPSYGSPCFFPAGFMVGRKAEAGGIAKDGAKMVMAVANAQVWGKGGGGGVQGQVCRGWGEGDLLLPYCPIRRMFVFRCLLPPDAW